MLRTVFCSAVVSLALFGCDGGDVSDTSEPRQARVAEHTLKMMAHLDSDKSGSISLEEAKGSMFEGHFAKADLDASGDVDSAELDEFTTVMHEEHAEHECEGDCSHHKGHGGHLGHGQKPEAHADEMIAKFDTDKDGALSHAEVEGHKFAGHFDSLDADDDDTITRTELVAAIEAKGKAHGKHGAHGPHGKHKMKAAHGGDAAE